MLCAPHLNEPEKTIMKLSKKLLRTFQKMTRIDQIQFLKCQKDYKKTNLIRFGNNPLFCFSFLSNNSSAIRFPGIERIVSTIVVK